MKAKFISTEGKSLLARIEINVRVLWVMDEFDGESLRNSSEIELMDSHTEYLTSDEVSESNRLFDIPTSQCF